MTDPALIRKIGSGRNPSHESPVVQERLKRLLKLVAVLSLGRYTVKELAPILETSPRTVARYLNTLQAADLEIDCDKYFQYFIAQDNCPICGKQPTTTALGFGHLEKSCVSK